MKYIICLITFFTSLSADQQKLTEYLSELVSIPTVTANKEENVNALHFVESMLSPLGLHFQYKSFEGHPTLVITTKDTMHPDLFLVAHIDVVPGPTGLFTPRIEGNRMLGRGAYDMKMAIACYILLMEELKDQLPDLNIGIMLTSDEEVGGMHGVKCLLEEGYSAKLAILPDGGFDWNFEEAAKGVLHLKIAAHGLSGHSSRPWMGKNAIEVLMKNLKILTDDFEKRKKGSYFPTANIGVIQGGKAPNVIPDYAEAKVDIRYPPEMEEERIYEELKALLPEVTLEITARGSPHQVDLQTAPFLKFKEIAKQLYGIEVGKVLSHGSSDARFFGERGVPVIVIAPKGGDIHSDSEWIDLEDLNRFYQVLKAFVCSNLLQTS